MIDDLSEFDAIAAARWHATEPAPLDDIPDEVLIEAIRRLALRDDCPPLLRLAALVLR